MQKKKITLTGLVSIGIGSVIGAGIFSMMGTGVYFTGRSIVIALVLATVMVFLQNFRSFILSGMFVLDGGRYEQSALTVPPLISGTTAINFMMQNIGMSVIALGIAQYLASVVPVLTNYTQVVALIVVTLGFICSIVGNKFISKVQTVIVVCMYVALGLFTVLGAMNRNPSAYAGEPYFHGGASGFLSAIVTLSYACQGASLIIDVTKDVENPKKNVPLALLLTTGAVAIMYAVLGYAATCSMPYASIAGQSLGVVAKQIMPTVLFLFFVIGGAIGALSSTLLSTIAGFPWPLYATARDGWLPAIFKKTNKQGYPWVIMLTMYLIAIIPIIGGFSLSTIVSYLLVPGSIIGLATNLVNFKIPEQYPEEWKNRSIRISATGYRIGMVISSLVAIFTALISLSTLDTFNMYCNLGMTVLLFLWAWIRIKTGKVDLKARKDYADQVAKKATAQDTAEY